MKIKNLIPEFVLFILLYKELNCCLLKHDSKYSHFHPLIKRALKLMKRQLSYKNKIKVTADTMRGS